MFDSFLCKDNRAYKHQKNNLIELSSLFDYQICRDQSGTEFVVLSTINKELSATETYTIENKAAFEAGINHVHLCDNIPKSSWNEAEKIAEKLSRGIFAALKTYYPERRFVVAGTLNEDTLVVTFHQKWSDEPPYYDPKDFNGESGRLILIQDED